MQAQEYIHNNGRINGIRLQESVLRYTRGY